MKVGIGDHDVKRFETSGESTRCRIILIRPDHPDILHQEKEQRFSISRKFPKSALVHYLVDFVSKPRLLCHGADDDSPSPRGRGLG